MRAVGRLLWTYFTGTPLGCGLTVAGVLALALGNLGLALMPAWAFDPTGLSGGPEAALAFLPWLAVIVTLFATSSMPVTVDRMMLGRQLSALPHGRLRLLASAVATAGLISLATAGTALVAFYHYPINVSLQAVFWRTLSVAFTTFGFAYFALWMLSKMRSGAGLLASALLVMLSIGLPLTYIDAPTVALPWPVKVGFAGWIGFGAALLWGRRAAHAREALRAWVSATRQRLPFRAYAEGTEEALLLGTSRPWILAIGQTVPIAIAALYFSVPGVWLFFFALFSAISGAVTSHAAARSRSLWLRTDVTRAQLFRRIERAYWHYNGYSLGVLLLLLVGLGSVLEFPTRLLALGLPLIVLGAAASSYLGLMVTKGLGVLEAVLAASTMGLLMAASIAAARSNVGVSVVVALEGALALLALLYRLLGQARWNALDWMLCRGDDLARGGRPA